MTVAIGLVCSDGVIVASDSMASSGQTAFPICKVHSSEPLQLIWTMAGSVYVSEEVEAEIANMSTDSSLVAAFALPDLNTIRTALSLRVRAVMQRCYQSALPFGQNQVINQSHHPFISDFLFMGWSGSAAWFLEVANDGSINWHTNIGFSAVGSGGPFASVAQALMAHYIDPKAMSVDDGVLIAHRAIETTCRVSSMFVGPPVWIATATEAGARVLSSEEIGQIELEVSAWMKIEQETLRDLRAVPEAVQTGAMEIPVLSENSDVPD